MANVSATNLTSLYSSVNGVSPVSSGYGNANVVGLLSAGTDGANTVGNISATGNIATGGILTDNYYYANGQPFSGGGGGTYGDSNVVTLMAAFGSNTVSTTGNVTSGNVNTTGVVSAGGNVRGANINTVGAVSATGNITGSFFLGNGSQLTGLPETYGNSNVSTLLAGFGSNAISTTGNVTAGFFVGNGSLLTNINAGNITGAYGNANVAAFLGAYGSNTISTTGSVTAGTVSASGNITGGNINTAGAVSATGNLRGANISLASRLIGDNGAVLSFLAGANTLSINGGGVGGSVETVTVSLGTLSTIGNITTANGSVNVNGAVSATGNVTGNFILGNGSLLTGLPATYGNANVAANLAAFGSNPISTTGNITAGRFFGDGGGLSNITVSTGTNISIAGNITAGGFSNIAGNSLYNSGLAVGYTFFPAGPEYINSLVVAGNVYGQTIGGNLGEFNTLSAAGNILAPGSTIVAATANVTTVNATGFVRATTGFTTSGTLTAVGNIQGSFFIGNGSALTGITVSTLPSLSVTGNVTAGNVNLVSGTVNAPSGNINNLDVQSLTASTGIGTSGSMSATGNITSNGGFTTGGSISATGNITGGNISTAGLLTAGSFNTTTFSATGNITGGNLITAPGGNLILGNSVSPGKAVFGAVEIQNNNNRFYVNTDQDLNGRLSAAGNVITGANVVAAGYITATGNISGNYFVGNGSLLTGITGSTAANSAVYLRNSADAGIFATLDDIGGGATTLTLPNGGFIYADGATTALVNNTANAATDVGFFYTDNVGNTNAVYASSSGSLLLYDVDGSVGGPYSAGIGAGGVFSATGNIVAGGNIRGGNITGVSSTVSTGILNYKDFVVTITYGSTITPNIALGSIQQVTLTGNVTMNAFGGTPQAGQSMVIKFIQDGTGGRTLTSSMKWAGGNKTLSTAANAVDIASVFYDGTTYWASLSLAYA